MVIFGFLPCSLHSNKTVLCPSTPERGRLSFFDFTSDVTRIRGSLEEASALACEQAAPAVHYSARKKDGVDYLSAIRGTESKEEP
jgi:hypothetical protein